MRLIHVGPVFFLLLQDVKMYICIIQTDFKLTCINAILRIIVMFRSLRQNQGKLMLYPQRPDLVSEQVLYINYNWSYLHRTCMDGVSRHTYRLDTIMKMRDKFHMLEEV